MTVKLREFYELGDRINREPLVAVFEHFLSEAEVNALVGAAASALSRAQVSGPDDAVTSPGRTGGSCRVSHQHDPVVAELCDRIAQVVGLPLEHAESLQVIHYQEGEEYAPHYDAWDPATERGRRCMARGGQRLVTCLMYLNDVPAGGGTCFPRLDLEVRARRGRMLLFHNCFPGSTVRHPDGLHGGMPVLQGEKWACNLWFRELPYQTVDAAPSGLAVPERSFRRVV